MFKAASPREQADVLELIREHGSELRGLTAEQAADAALVRVLPMPWCEPCGSYHHPTAPHIERVVTDLPPEAPESRDAYVLRALRACKSLDDTLTRSELAPTGDDYNSVMAIILDALTRAETPG